MKMLVLGASGQIGSAFCAKYPEVIGLSHAQLDITNRRAVRDCLQFENPTVILNCAGTTDPDKCHEINVEGVRNILHWIQPDCKFIQLSPACVFRGGASQQYGIYSARAPLTPYGVSKRNAENLIANWHQNDNFIIIRTGEIYGWGFKNFVTYCLDCITTNQPIYASTTRIQFMSVSQFIQYLWEIILQTNTEEIYHVVPFDSTSYYDAAKYLCEILDSSVPIIAEEGESKNLSLAQYIIHRLSDPKYWKDDMFSFLQVNNLYPKHLYRFEGCFRGFTEGETYMMTYHR